LVGHGTRDPQGSQEFVELARLVAQLIAPLPVEKALLEFQTPTIEQAWLALVEQGSKRMVISPLLLFAAGHAKDDIPSAVQALHRPTINVQWKQARPLSRDQNLVDLAVQRICEAIPNEVALQECTLLCVGRGSRDPCAQADTRVLAEVLGSKLGVRQTHTAFYAMASPCLVQMLDFVAGPEQGRHVIVYPHLLFAGEIYRSIAKQVQDSANKAPHTRFYLASYLGAQPEVAQAVVHRIQQVRF
jgi:sirohydrochlorin cobaltochelatase